ncbi:ComF family protein, partial [Neisseria sp. P0021.S002]
MNVLSWWRNLKRLNARRCILCHDAVSDGLCRGCANDLTEYFIDAAQSCPLCFRHVAGGAVCGGCQKKPPAFDRMWASLYYEPPVSSMIRELKHLADLGMSRPLSDLMSQNAPDWLAAEHFDFV